MKKISKPVYYQLLGLFLYHERLETMRHEVEKTVADLVGEKIDENNNYYYGHVSDCLFDKKSVEDMLDKLDIEIEGE